MSRFRLKWMLKGRPARNRPEEDLERRELRLGTSPNDDILLTDQLVAERALIFRATPTGDALLIEPRDLFAGAFLNGKPIDDTTRFEPGDVLQVGQALVSFTIEDDAYALEIYEDYLGHTIFQESKRELSIDLEGWGEAHWGRSRFLRRANLAALLLGIAALAAFPFSTESSLLSRGPLSPVHQAAGVSCRRMKTLQPCSTYVIRNT